MLLPKAGFPLWPARAPSMKRLGPPWLHFQVRDAVYDGFSCKIPFHAVPGT